MTRFQGVEAGFRTKQFLCLKNRRRQICADSDSHSHLFKTARIAEAPLAEDGYHVGRMVGIEYLDTRTNAAAGYPVMPVYAIDGKFSLLSGHLCE